MTRNTERLVVLGVVGVVLVAVQHLGPLAWPFGLGPSWSIVNQAWFLAVDLLWVVAMLVSNRRDPSGPMWRIFLAYLGLGALAVIWIVPTSLTWTLSQLLVGFGAVVFVHLVLAFPTGRLTDRFDRLLVGGAYAFVAASRIAWVLVWTQPVDKVGFSPRNPFVVWPNADLAWLFGPLAILALTPVLFAAVIVGLVRHWRRASPALRRALLPMAIAAPIQLGLTVAWHFAGTDPSEWGALRALLQHPIVGLAGAVFPVGLLAGLVLTRLSRGSIADLAVELGRGVPIGGLRATLARALRDPTLQLAFPAPDGTGFVGPDGRPVELPDPARPERRLARLEHGGETLAVLVYDPQIETEDPGRAEAVASMARLALENERLAAQVRAQLEEVRASRARIVEAADAERRRIERDLHDGAQQRLVALAMRLDQARAGSAGAAALIDSTTAELLTAIREVRDLARGVHPTILTDAGLAAAVEALAERSPIPVRIDVTPARFATEIEAAAYFVIAEGLTNVARYAGASEARVEVVEADGRLRVSVSDDGRGGADPEAGSGLRGLADRVAAIGGRLDVTSGAGGGTLLLADLPART
ncbi:MAG TPA: histidine kinase [Candidatus Limnocylindrales bacterium]|nr:histidine kinase [Candidatus Limnocylindrales bacterium]